MTTDISPRRFRTADGLDIVGDIGGDPSGPPVVLLHGGGQTRHSWGGAMRELIAHGFHVINLDARGHGDSGWSPTGTYSMDSFASDLRMVIETLPSPPALIGASLGGATALYLVGNTPEPVATALVLVDIVPRPNPAGTDRIVNFMRANPGGFASLDAAADAVALFYPERPRPKDSSGLLKNLRKTEDGRFHWHWDPAFVHQPRRMEPPTFADLLLDACAGIHIPTLLVRGMKSDVVTDESVAEFLRRLPGLEVFNVAEAGHMVAGDKNDAFNQGVIEFLDRHRARR